MSKTFKRILMLLGMTLCITPATAYEIYLDIDTDGDPSTINTFTWDTVCTVNLVVWPTELHEELWSFSFGLGGSCLECGGSFTYGTEHDLGDFVTWTWNTHPFFAGTWDYATSINCPDNPGFHAVFMAESIIDCCFYLDEPTVFGTFEVLKIENGPECPVPSNLAVMSSQGAEGIWNYIQVGGPAIGNQRVSWGVIKDRYR